MWKGIQNVKYAKMVAYSHDYECKLVPYILPCMNLLGSFMIPSFQWFLMTRFESYLISQKWRNLHLEHRHHNKIMLQQINLGLELLNKFIQVSS